MGYYMNQRDAIFTIKKDKQAKALKAVQALAKPSKIKKGGGGSWSGGKQIEQYYSWVNTEEFVSAKTLQDAMQAWRWDIHIDVDGNLVDIYFAGEKLGDDAILFEALAPFVEDGCYIEMSGEEGALWR